jgi:hypothetical protein
MEESKTWPLRPPEPAAEVRPPTGWDEAALSPSVDTAEKRLAAAASVIRNGNQTLTVLVMPSHTEGWLGYPSICNAIRDELGYQLVKKNTTKGALVKTIEPVGAAARSTLDDTQWALTPFGIAVKPVLIFAWQRLLDLHLDGVQVFGATSRQQPGTGAEPPSTPAASRIRVLHALAARAPRRIVELGRAAGAVTSIRGLLAALQQGGIVDRESVDTQRGDPVTFYAVTEQGRALTLWPLFERISHASERRTARMYSKQVQHAVRSLAAADEEISVGSIIAFMNRIYKPTTARNPSHVGAVLSFYVRCGLLAYQHLHWSESSRVWLTDLGQQVVGQILEPLTAWSHDPRVVPEINDIAVAMQQTPDVYRDRPT